MNGSEGRHWGFRHRTRRLAAGAAAIAAIISMVSSARVPARAGGDTVITIDFVETHDRLPPDERLGIVRQHQIVATLSTDNRVHESNQSYSTRGKKSFTKQGENSEAIGDNSAKVVWHVLGPHKLQRIFAGRQFLMMADIEIGAGDSCNVQIKYLLQKGYSDIITRRADNGEPAHFSLPKLVSSECSIH